MEEKSTNGVHRENRSDAGASKASMKPSAPPPLPEKERSAPPPKATRQGVASVFKQFGQLVHAKSGPFPTQLGGLTYISANKKGKIKNDLKYIGWKDVKTVLELARSKLKGEQHTDDKTMIMERVIQLVAGLPDNSRLREELTNVFLNELWYTLDHPPLLYVGEKHQYRMADGSWNNPMNPMLGAAGSTYARTCRPSVIPLGSLPDPELIYESVMRRTSYRKHPNNVSSVLWYWATIIIHDLFWTDFKDHNKTKTSSYLDLSPLYGSNQEMQDTIRTFKDGLLKPDSYADKRLHGMPPGCSVILIMFNRFHNHVAANLAAINEGGRFTKPSVDLEGEKAAAAWKKYDNDLFQTARLVTSGLYINITLVDYVRNIVNLNRSNTTWTLDPRQEMGKNAGTAAGSERGTGSMVSAEFNLAYRWHSNISDKDDKWIQGFFGEMFGKDPGTLTIHDLMSGSMKFEKSIAEDPAERVFGGYKRNADGRFNDDDLVNCISDAIEDCAGAFGGRNVPGAMKPVEVLGILQGRKWNVAGLNEFRKHFGLKPFERFEDINSDPDIASALKHLYEHPDFVELYPGLVAEEAKEPMVPGVGIAPTYTISRVILSDAVCLTRGDRFYTTDYSPRFLTSWGYNEVSYDLNLNQGCVFYKLFVRAFPNHFKSDSAYAHYPMCVPSETKKILTNLGRVQDFSFDRPAYRRPCVSITTSGGAEHILENDNKFRAHLNGGAASLAGSAADTAQSLLPGASPTESINTEINKAGWRSHIKNFYAQVTDQLIREKSYRLANTNFVDLVRDVGNLGPVHFVARTFDLPLRTPQNPKGIYTEQELYVVLAVIYSAIYADIDPVRAYPTRLASKAVAAQLAEAIESRLRGGSGFGGMFGAKTKRDDPLATYGTNLINGLKKSGLTNHDITWNQLLPALSASVPSTADYFAQAVDFYLTPAGSQHIPELNRLANLPSSPETDSLLLGYCMEGIRLSGTSGSYREVAVDDVIMEDDGRQVPVSAGNRVFVNSAAARDDDNQFHNPGEVNPRHPLDSYVHFGLGAHSLLGKTVAQTGLAEMFRAVFRLKNVRRAPGVQGELRKVRRPDGTHAYLREDGAAYAPFPCTMKICYD
jgi:hypothetical protein